jgi:hypothetical protein
MEWKIYLFSGVLEERYHSQFIAIYADIKEVSTKNLKGLVKQEGESSPRNLPVPI